MIGINQRTTYLLAVLLYLSILKCTKGLFQYCLHNTTQIQHKPGVFTIVFLAYLVAVSVVLINFHKHIRHQEG